MATISNLFIDAGSAFTNIISLSASNGLPLNLTGYTVKSQIRKSYTSTISHTFAASVYSTATLGKVKLELTATQTEAITPGRWLYDVEITSSGGVKTRVIEGIITVTPQITQI